MMRRSRAATLGAASRYCGMRCRGRMLGPNAASSFKTARASVRTFVTWWNYIETDALRSELWSDRTDGPTDRHVRCVADGTLDWIHGRVAASRLVDRRAPRRPRRDVHVPAASHFHPR